MISPTNQISMEDQDSKHKVSLHRLLKPTLVFLSFAGCYRLRKDVTDDDGKQKDRNTSKWTILGIIYRILCFTLCVMHCVKGFAAAAKPEGANSKVNFQIIFLLWYIQSTFIFLIFLKTDSTRFGHLIKAMQFWDSKIVPDMEVLQIDFNKDKFRKWQKYYIITGVFMTLINIMSLGVMCSPLFSEYIRDQIVSPFQYSDALLVMVLILSIPVVFLWIIPVLSIMIISKLLTIAFEDYNSFLEKYLSKMTQSKSCKLYELRLLHLNLCKMVTDLDGDLGYYYASSFVFHVGMSCYILYQVIKIPMSAMNQCVFLLWLVSDLGFLSAISVAAACVNQAVSTSTLKFLNLGTPEKIAVINLNFKQRSQILGYFVKKMQRNCKQCRP